MKSPTESLPDVEPDLLEARRASRVEADDDDDDALDDRTRFEALGDWLEGQQWLPVVLFVVGGIAVIFDASIGISIMGSAVILAGVVPLVTGRYRGPLGTLRGLAARLRGLVSVIIGIVILWLGRSL